MQIVQCTKEELIEIIESVISNSKAPEKMKDELLTHEEVMNELKIKRTRYFQLKKEGLIPVRGLGTLERVLKSELYARFETINEWLRTA